MACKAEFYDILDTRFTAIQEHLASEHADILRFVGKGVDGVQPPKVQIQPAGTSNTSVIKISQAETSEQAFSDSDDEAPIAPKEEAAAPADGPQSSAAAAVDIDKGALAKGRSTAPAGVLKQSSTLATQEAIPIEERTSRVSFMSSESDDDEDAAYSSSDSLKMPSQTNRLTIHSASSGSAETNRLTTHSASSGSGSGSARHSGRETMASRGSRMGKGAANPIATGASGASGVQQLARLCRSHTKETGLAFMVAPVWAEDDAYNPTSFADLSRKSKSRKSNAFERADSVDDGRVSSKSHWFVLTPNSAQHIAWDVLGAVMIVLDLITVPLQFFEAPEGDFDRAVLWCTRCFWTFDMPVSMVTAYVKADATLEMNFTLILLRYAKTWLVLDTLIIACDWTGAAFGASGEANTDSTKTLRNLRMLRMMRLLRMTRLPILFNMMVEQAGLADWTLTCDILRIICFFLGVSHLIACFWYAIGRQEPTGNLNWIAQQGFEDEPLGYRYVTSLHWSVTQFIGSMDVRAWNWLERSYSCCVLVFAFIISASFVSSITSAMTRHHIQRTRQNNQIAGLQRYLHQNGISQPLVLRIQRNAQYALNEQQRNVPESDVELIHLVSEPLRIELHFELYASALLHHPFFHHYHAENPAAMRMLCHKAVFGKHLSAGDVLFSAGEIATNAEMFFVCRGALKYCVAEGSKEDIAENTYICEPVLWTAFWSYVGTLRASAECRLLVLRGQVFQDVACQFNDGDFSVSKFATLFVEELNEAGAMLTDIGNIDDSMALVSRVYSLEGAHDLNGHSSRPSLLSSESVASAMRNGAESANLWFGRIASISSKRGKGPRSSVCQLPSTSKGLAAVVPATNLVPCQETENDDRVSVNSAVNSEHDAVELS